MSWLYLLLFCLFSPASALCLLLPCPINTAAVPPAAHTILPARHCPLMYSRIIPSISKPLPSRHMQLFSQKMQKVDNLFRI